MITQPLSKSDWDGHPVWWLRNPELQHDYMVLEIAPDHITTTHGLRVSYDRMIPDGWQRSHDRIHWTPCSREVKEPPLQLREGAWYERRDGKIVGPCKRNAGRYPWEVFHQNGTSTYHRDDGQWDDCPCKMDLIREVPPPQPCTISKAEADKHAVTENRVAQPDTVDVEKLIEFVRPYAVLNGCVYGDNNLKAMLQSVCERFAALHPRLKEEVETK